MSRNFMDLSRALKSLADAFHLIKLKLDGLYDSAGAIGGEFELIETITLTEDVASIERATEPDTTPYNFESVIITAEIAQAESNRNLRISLNNDGITFVIYRARVTNSTSYSIAKIFKKANLFDFSTVYSSTSTGISNGVVLNTPYIVNAVPITSITMTMLSDVIPAGSVIKIYAVRK